MKNKPNQLDDLISLIHKSVYVSKNYHNAVATIDSLSDIIKDNTYIKHVYAYLALEFKNYQRAADLFHELNEAYQEGFCHLLVGNEKKAKTIWLQSQKSPAITWGIALLSMIHGTITLEPTFLQIRNFLEHDLQYFLTGKQDIYVQNIVKLADQLSSINIESYKYIGRVFLNNGCNNVAAKYLELALNVLPDDPEIYFLIANFYIDEESMGDARKFLDRCLEVSPGYKPAEILLTAL